MGYCPNCCYSDGATAAYCPRCGQRIPQQPGAAPVGAYSPQHAAAGNTVSHNAPPDTHLAKAIFATVMCCIPFGIVAIVQASSVNSKFQSGDIAGAWEASRQANNWGNWSIWTGAAVGVVYIGIMIIGAVADS
jgi:hypothetical protein